MLAVFALHGVQRREEAGRLLGLLSKGLPVSGNDGGEGPTTLLAFDPKTLVIADRALAELGVAAWALEIMDAHHFTTPGLMSVLNGARLRSGVLAPAQFAFLKLVDRRLWYALRAGLRGGRSARPSPPELEGGGNRRPRLLGGRTGDRSADSHAGIQRGDRRDPA
jgi:intracellular multiplication protein IcmP